MSAPSGSQASGAEAKNEAAGTTRVAFRFHARALAALGRDLVTSDIVAVMELVKNAYDALATRVEVRIRSGDEDSNGPYIEIADDGHSMDYEMIVNVWCIDLRHLALVGLPRPTWRAPGWAPLACLAGRRWPSRLATTPSSTSARTAWGDAQKNV